MDFSYLLFITTPSRGAPPQGSPIGADSLRDLLDEGRHLRRSAPSHFVWYERDGATSLFVGGEAYEVDSAAFAELLCGTRVLDGEGLAPSLGVDSRVAIVRDLVLRGFLIPTGV